MSADPIVARWARPTRRRIALADLLTAGPLLLLATIAAWRFGGGWPAVATAIFGCASVAGWIAARLRQVDARWIARRIDALHEAAEDSAGLLFAAENGLSRLQRLQRQRLLGRLSDDIGRAIEPALPLRRIALAALALLPALGLLLWPQDAVPGLAPSREGLPAIPGVPRLVGQRLRIVPPAYTGLPAHYAEALDGKAPEGSYLEWTLRFDPAPRAAAIAFAGGGSAPLVAGAEAWSARRRLDGSILYRVVPAGAPLLPAPPLHRFEAVPDLAPTIRVVTPEKTLSPIAPGQRSWSLRFEARDDYGVAPAARLRLTVASGDGENVTFRERTMTLGGSGPAMRRRFAASLDLKALGFTGPGDLVAQLVVADTRSPGPHIVRGPSLILRWPSDAGAQGSGLDAMARKALPAYFASERQIIIDAEALIHVRSKLDHVHFLARSDALGADQQGLRMRYAQFMGQEDEGRGNTPPPTADAAMPVADDAPPGAPVTFGESGEVTREYGHVHDEAEATTLLDADTHATLKLALDNMWDAEVRLRTGDPTGALPFANKALVYIKRVQQATRIFLARTGTNLPPIDEGRRMTGKREGIADRDAPLAAPPPGDPAPAAAWRALAGAGDVPLAPLEAWLRANAGRVADPLAIAAAIDGVRREPACAACRQKLRAALWAVLPRPPANALRRAKPDAAGERYLDTLGR